MHTVMFVFYIQTVLDREMSIHLEQVKDLELQLADEKKAVASANRALEQCIQEMKGNEVQCHELQSKLCSAYQEVSGSLSFVNLYR